MNVASNALRRPAAPAQSEPTSFSNQACISAMQVKGRSKRRNVPTCPLRDDFTVATKIGVVVQIAFGGGPKGFNASGGPPVTAPERNGFGTTLLKSAFGSDATPRLEYAPQGLHYIVEVALSEVAGESGVEKTRWKQGQPSIDASRPMAR